MSLRPRRLHAAVATAALAMSAACSASLAVAPREVPTIARRASCIELTDHGLAAAAINASLVEFALADAKRMGKSLKFYRVVAGPVSHYYVFQGRWSDIYTIYETTPQKSKFAGKYQYGSFHHPCPIPGNGSPARVGTIDTRMQHDLNEPGGFYLEEVFVPADGPLRSFWLGHCYRATSRVRRRDGRFRERAICRYQRAGAREADRSDA